MQWKGIHLTNKNIEYVSKICVFLKNLNSKFGFVLRFNMNPNPSNIVLFVLRFVHVTKITYQYIKREPCGCAPKKGKLVSNLIWKVSATYCYSTSKFHLQYLHCNLYLIIPYVGANVNVQKIKNEINEIFYFL